LLSKVITVEKSLGAVLGLVKPVTLNPIAALVKTPVTSIVFELTAVQLPVKSIKELQDSTPIIKLLAKVSCNLAGTLLVSVGLKLICSETGSA